MRRPTYSLPSIRAALVQDRRSRGRRPRGAGPRGLRRPAPSPAGAAAVAVSARELASRRGSALRTSAPSPHRQLASPRRRGKSSISMSPSRLIVGLQARGALHHDAHLGLLHVGLLEGADQRDRARLAARCAPPPRARARRSASDSTTVSGIRLVDEIVDRSVRQHDHAVALLLRVELDRIRARARPRGRVHLGRRESSVPSAGASGAGAIRRSPGNSAAASSAGAASPASGPASLARGGSAAPSSCFATSSARAIDRARLAERDQQTGRDRHHAAAVEAAPRRRRRSRRAPCPRAGRRAPRRPAPTSIFAWRALFMPGRSITRRGGVLEREGRRVVDAAVRDQVDQQPTGRHAGLDREQARGRARSRGAATGASRAKPRRAPRPRPARPGRRRARPRLPARAPRRPPTDPREPRRRPPARLAHADHEALAAGRTS